jgi:putative transposase
MGVTLLVLRELREKQQIANVTFLVVDAGRLGNALDRLGRRFRACHHGNRNAIERVDSKVK